MASRPYTEIYRAGGNPGGTVNLPMATPAAFGAGVGEGFAELGGAIERAVIEDRDRDIRRDRETEAAEAGVELARVTGEIEAEVQRMRTKAGTGAAGHSEALDARLEAMRRQYLDGTDGDGNPVAAGWRGIRDERVRNIYAVRFAEMAERVAAREEGWQAGQEIEHKIDQLGEQGRLIAARLAAAPDEDALEQAHRDIEAAWNLQEGLPEAVRTRGIREQQHDATVAYANALQDANPQALAAILEQRVLEPWLTPEDITTLRRGAQVEIRRQEAQARAAAALAEAEQREAIGAVLDRVAANIGVPDDELAAAEQQAVALGDERLAQRIGIARVEEHTRRATEAWLPERFDAEISRLLALGEDRSNEQDVELAWLQRRAPAARRELADNSGQWAARAGDPAPPIDLAHPETIAARVAWMNRVARATGRPPAPLLRDDVEQLRGLVSQGGDAQLGAIRILRQFGAGARAAARQVADNELLALAVTLPDYNARQLVFGQAALAGNRDIVDEQRSQEIFNDNAAAIPELARPGLRAAVLTASRRIYASMAAEVGNTAFNEEGYRMAIHRALGAQGAGDGMRGGLHDYRGSLVWLPPDWTAAEFDRVVGQADGEAWSRAAGGASYWQAPDGSRGRVLYSAELRAGELVPADGPGRYYVRVGNGAGVAVGADNRPIVFDVTRMRD